MGILEIDSEYIQKEELTTLGLVCHWVKTVNNKFYYHIMNIGDSKKIDIYVTQQELNNIEEYMKNYYKEIRLKN